MKHLGHLSALLFILFHQSTLASVLEPILKDEGAVSPGNDYYLEKQIDYQHIVGRVSDYDKKSHLLKIHTETNNIKFFKVGDLVRFTINRHEQYKIPCKGNIRHVEDFYFVIFVRDLGLCWNQERYFPRGVMINIESADLKERVSSASDYRRILVRKKRDFLAQLNRLNNDIWTYHEKKMKMAAEYDLKVNELKKQKQSALDNLLQKKKDNMKMRNILMGKLDGLDEKLHFYRIERQEPLLDRWNLDHDTGLPMARRPTKAFKRER